MAETKRDREAELAVLSADELEQRLREAFFYPDQIDETVFRELEERGVHNLNLVTGTPFVPQILKALEMAAPSIPVVWNTSGYETPETVRALAERVSVFLPDMKYALPEPARRPSGRWSASPDPGRRTTTACSAGAC